MGQDRQSLHGQWLPVLPFLRVRYNSAAFPLIEKQVHFDIFLRRFFRRELPAGVVDGVGLGQDQPGDGHHSVAIVDEAGEDGGQRLRCVQRSVVEQHDAARLDLGGHALADGVRVVVLPIQRVPIGKDLKPLRRKGLRVWRRCASGKNLTCKRGVWRVVQAREGSKIEGVCAGVGGV